MAGVVELIWVVGEAEYFSGKDWTTQITLIANENFVSARTVCTVQWGAQPWVPALRRSAEGAPHRVRDTIGGAPDAAQRPIYSIGVSAAQKSCSWSEATFGTFAVCGICPVGVISDPRRRSNARPRNDQHTPRRARQNERCTHQVH